MPLGDQIAQELTSKLETPIEFDFTHLYAHDLVGRTQAFDRLISGGVDVARALAISGLAMGE